MESIKKSRADLIKLAETKGISPTHSLNLLETFDYCLLQHSDIEIRKLACLCIFTLLSTPRFMEKSPEVDEEKNNNVHKPIYIPLVFKDDIIYLEVAKDLRQDINGFHPSLVDLITNSPGFLQKRLFGMVRIDSIDGLISSFDRNQSASKQIAQMEDPLTSRAFCSGADFWRKHADFQFCRIGAGEEDLPLSTEATQSSCSSKSSEKRGGMKLPSSFAKAKFVIASRNHSPHHTKSFAKLASLASFSNSQNADRNPNSSKSNSSKNITTGQMFRVKKCARSSFAHSSKIIRLGSNGHDSHLNLEGSKTDLLRRESSQRVIESKAADISPVIRKRTFKQSAKRRMSPTLTVSKEASPTLKRSRFAVKGKKDT